MERRTLLAMLTGASRAASLAAAGAAGESCSARMISLVGPILVLLLSLWLVSRLARGQSGRALWVKATAFIAAFRLDRAMGLLLLHWRDALGLWAVPLIMMLLPEGFRLPRNQVWTSGTALIASVLVMIGSVVWAGATVAVLRLCPGGAKPVASG